MAKLPIITPETPPEEAPVQSPLHFAASLSPKRVYIETFGCQMNIHDSQRMVSLMAGEGYTPTDGPEDADLIILNSCSVRDKAEQKVRSRAGEMKRIKKARPDVVLAIGGCVAQQEGQRMLDRIPYADIVFGPDHLSRLPELVRRVQQGDGRRNETGFLDRATFRFAGITEQAPHQPSAFVSVMKGCDKFCAFCIVPFTRGREVSRPSDDVIGEVRQLAERGTREVVLLGQTVNTYGQRKRDDQIPFHELLARVCAIDGIERVRFTSPHPADFTDGQIEAFANLPELCPHMHLPVQSGSDRVLKAMRRGYTRAQYLEVVDKLREVAPHVALGTDIIVGFPGETREDFEQTLSLVERVQYHSAYSFAYSERVGTRALDIEGAVPVEERFERLRALQALQDRITKAYLDAMVGTRQEIMVEGPSKTDPIAGVRSNRPKPARSRARALRTRHLARGRDRRGLQPFGARSRAEGRRCAGSARGRVLMPVIPFGAKMPKLASDVFVAPGAHVIGDVEMGAQGSVWFGTQIRGDVHHIRIGDRVNIQDNSVVHVTTDTNPTIIGNNVTVGHRVILHGCTVHDGSADRHGRDRDGPSGHRRRRLGGGRVAGRRRYRDTAWHACDGFSGQSEAPAQGRRALVSGVRRRALRQHCDTIREPAWLPVVTDSLNCRNINAVHGVCEVRPRRLCAKFPADTRP